VSSFTDCTDIGGKSVYAGIYFEDDYDWYKAKYEENETCPTPWTCYPNCFGEDGIQVDLLVGDDAQMQLCVYWNPSLGDPVVTCKGNAYADMGGPYGSDGCCEESDFDGDGVNIKMDFDGQFAVDKGDFYFFVRGMGNPPYTCDFEYELKYGIY